MSNQSTLSACGARHSLFSSRPTGIWSSWNGRVIPGARELPPLHTRDPRRQHSMEPPPVRTPPQKTRATMTAARARPASLAPARRVHAGHSRPRRLRSKVQPPPPRPRFFFFFPSHLGNVIIAPLTLELRASGTPRTHACLPPKIRRLFALMPRCCPQ